LKGKFDNREIKCLKVDTEIEKCYVSKSLTYYAYIFADIELNNAILKFFNICGKFKMKLIKTSADPMALEVALGESKINLGLFDLFKTSLKLTKAELKF
jgi:hypothetical protein